ncbi:retinol dehydrogenase 13-like [Liolophura sinensis]|uniref:retinol dehydrogenase 13-like n=1 Tax=Liolophura sinensis TaxID=3198878 RepID=UPI003158188A
MVNLEGLPNPDKIFDSWYPILIGIVIGVLYGFRAYFRGAQCYSATKLTGKTAIVTGASSGIGEQIALDFAQRGARVILACKNEEAAKETVEYIKRKSKKKHDVVVLPLDLSSFKSIRKFVETFKTMENKLHILVNNAGTMMGPQKETEDKFEEQFQVNYLGHFLLTNLLLDVMKSSGSGRIINVTASAYKLGEINFDDINGEKEAEFNSGKQFSQCKLAVILFSQELARRLEGTGINVYCANPGITNTNIHRHFVFKTNAFVSLSFSPFTWFLMKSAYDGAQTAIHCAVADEVKDSTGKYYSECNEAVLESQAIDDDLAKKLWQESVKWTRLERDATAVKSLNSGDS